MFEEINHDLGLKFCYQWNSSNMYGFVRKSSLVNTSENNYKITMLDGIQNIMPHGVDPDMQTSTSNLADAYKRNELIKETGLGIYALSAIIVDKAEPSEALKANIAWSTGIENARYLVSSLQLDKFRKNLTIEDEFDVKGEKGAYFIHAEVSLGKNAAKDWKIIANVNQAHAQIIDINHRLHSGTDFDSILDEDIENGTRKLMRLITGSDGKQYTADKLKDARHLSNVLFNIKRGGIFDNNYQIEKNDFVVYLRKANTVVFARNQDFISHLSDTFDAFEMYNLLSGSDDADLLRLCKEYLPLKFSRRHGDPSRPWNKFSINTNSELDGSKILDYEGNWRDIFQNWEALVHSYPGFIEGMIFKFLNASTFDGYNPYRVTKDGFDWETIEPDNPWSYIGYWGDHQIIYLLKFLEFYQTHQPKAINELLSQACFAYANVPYRIKSYDQIVIDPKNTIEFDEESDLEIRAKIEEIGADGALRSSKQSDIHRVNFLEKILVTVLSKMSNFIPEGGIWMNTQRPEWNDANNALVGNGVSMVTLYYLRRFLKFFERIIAESGVDEVTLSQEVSDLFVAISEMLHTYQDALTGKIDDTARKAITDALGQAGSDYREQIYKNGFSGNKNEIKLSSVSDFIQISLAFAEHTIKANRRTDALYHAYNLMTINNNGIAVSHLSEMLEGQVAAISSGYLNSDAVIKLLDSMRISSLYREDQNSYMLYPNKALPRFLEKNIIPKEAVENSPLLKKLVHDYNLLVIVKDVEGNFHFNGNFKNAGDLKVALADLSETSYKNLVDQDGDQVLQLFEDVFQHKSFTGRSGTFFAYEGLGSIYWHMVSKLHLAVHEACERAVKENASADTLQRLLEIHTEIGDGIGVHKTPELYGAFPTDPYSHTPEHRGAQQPGMTGQVKEDVLVRFGELGVVVRDASLGFAPTLLKKSEFLAEELTVEFVNIHQQKQEINLKPQSLCFSYCQVPVIYKIADDIGAEVFFNDGTTKLFDTPMLDEDTSSQIFQRTGAITKIVVHLTENQLKQ